MAEFVIRSEDETAFVGQTAPDGSRSKWPDTTLWGARYNRFAVVKLHLGGGKWAVATPAELKRNDLTVIKLGGQVVWRAQAENQTDADASPVPAFPSGEPNTPADVRFSRPRNLKEREQNETVTGELRQDEGKTK